MSIPGSRSARATVDASPRFARRAVACPGPGARAARSLAGALGVWVALSVPAGALAARAAAARPQSAVAPLPASNYLVRAVCAPPAPGYASCLALKLVPLTPAARAHNRPIGRSVRRAPSLGRASESAFGLRPSDLHSGYALPTEAPLPQTIALVDAYNDPTAEQDLAVYDAEFHLPPCTRENGCFRKVNQAGAESPLPETEGGWASEIALDIETAHAICQNCRILLVEASNSRGGALEAAEETAVALGATEISNSWGAPGEAIDTPAFNHPGIVITAATGDYGYLNWNAPFTEFVGHPDYPATSPHVVAVGGTRLRLSVESAWQSESVWNDGSTVSVPEPHGASGGGCSESFAAPEWQTLLTNWVSVGCATKRSGADVSADADPYTGVAVYDSTPPESGWTAFGGTSLASPIIAATFALAGGANGVEYAAKTLYSHVGASSLHDITVGSNG
ncbi:MAG: S53 family peptidase, partial [Acidobacteriota bacterium]|nr:S53 family peptidase [Acidobacteriota bacterium]